MGSVSATEQFLMHSPPLKPEIENLKLEIQKSFSDINLKEIPTQVIAIAGTATTLACMNLGLKEFYENEVNNITISVQNIRKIIEDLNYLGASDILDKYGSVMVGREDIIFAGAYILLQFMETFKFDSIKVSTRGIRYGAVVKYQQSVY